MSDNPVCYLVAKDFDKKGQNSVGSTIFLINRDEHIGGFLWAYYIMIIGMQTL